VGQSKNSVEQASANATEALKMKIRRLIAEATRGDYEVRHMIISMLAYQNRFRAALELFDFDQLEQLWMVLNTSRHRQATVFVAGNGGSATTATHIANDWMLGTGIINPPLRVICLTDNSAALTATGNDQTFERIFVRQLEHLARPGDLLVGISASGNSENLAVSFDYARKIGVNTVGITGFDGGTLAKMADLSIHVATDIGDYGVAEDIHLLIGHAVKELLMSRNSSSEISRDG